MEVHALAAWDWSISAIARHVGRGRKTDELMVEQAQADVDAFAATRGDTRIRRGHSDGAGSRASVATVAATEPLRPVPPAPYPAELLRPEWSPARVSSPTAATPTRCRPSWWAPRWR